MSKIITKTSYQHNTEISSLQLEKTCPECGKVTLFGNKSIRSTGFFKVQIFKKNYYSCISCGCKWETEWKKQS